MCKVILVGADTALLEGLAQTLLGCGHDVAFAGTVAEAGSAMNGDETCIAVVSNEALDDAATTLGFNRTDVIRRSLMRDVYSLLREEVARTKQRKDQSGPWRFGRR